MLGLPLAALCEALGREPLAALELAPSQVARHACRNARPVAAVVLATADTPQAALGAGLPRTLGFGCPN
eukprot:6663904-Lingulodinium_polyedra.AAC.1